MRNFSICFLTIISISLACQCDRSCNPNTISIVGAGKVKVNPDIAIFTVSITGLKPTSLEALSFVNQQSSKVNNILVQFGIPVGNRTTSSINLRPQYRYNKGVAILVGQQASQSLRVSVGNIQQDSSLLGKMISSLSTVRNSTLSGFNFQNQNTDSAYQLARQAAVKDAQAKAQQYAQLSSKRLGSVTKVLDQNR